MSVDDLMKMSWLQILLDNISSFLKLSSRDNINSDPSQKYYTKGQEISKILKPVLESLVHSDTDIASNELLNNGFEELAQYIDELRQLFHSFCHCQCQPLSSRLYSVIKIGSLVSKVRESSMEVLQLLTHFESSSSSSIEQCLDEINKMGKEEEIYLTIHQALKDQRDGVGPNVEVLMKIAENLGLKSNQEILIESVILEGMKENGETELIDQLGSIVINIHDYFTKVKQSQMNSHGHVPVPPDFCCPLSLQLMTDPVIISSGQTYERVFIQNWIDMGLMICPKTRQVLSDTTLTSNFIVKAFITNWCESNNVKASDPMDLIRSSHSFPLETGVCDSITPNDSLFVNGSIDVQSERASSSSSDCTEDGTDSDELPLVVSRSTSPGRQVLIETTWCSPSGRRLAGTSLSIETEVKKLVEDLKDPTVEIQRKGTARIRILSRNSTDNRIVIAKYGAISVLVNLLNSSDTKIQADAVTALLNLSINGNNKSVISEAGAIEPLIHVLKTGNLEARENSAATLYSLSVIEENKIKIGRAGGIKPLVDLLGNGSLRGKKDAATALFNLSKLHENKALIVQAGAVRHLIELMEPRVGLVDRAVVVLANLATIKEGKVAIGQDGGIAALVEAVELGSVRGRENAAAALLQVCVYSPLFCNMAIKEGAIPPLVALSRSGTARARDKAHNLLKYFRTQRQRNHETD